MKLTKDNLIIDNYPFLDGWIYFVKIDTETEKEAEQLKQQILEQQDKSHMLDRILSAFREPIDWRYIEYFAAKEVNKDLQEARLC